MQTTNKNTTVPLDGNIPRSAFGLKEKTEDIIVGSCLGSGRSGEAVTYNGRILSYRCKKCGRTFGLIEVQGPTYRTLPNH